MDLKTIVLKFIFIEIWNNRNWIIIKNKILDGDVIFVIYYN